MTIELPWAQRAVERSPTVQRSRVRSMRQARQIVDAARRLINERGEHWTTQDLAKEAGIAIQTFYRYFTGKDQLLLAVIEELMAESAVEFADQARAFDDPIDRLEFYIKSAFATVQYRDLAGARFITAQHWRLHQLFPDDLALATRTFANLLADQIRIAQQAGTLAVADADLSAALVTRLVMVEYHFYAFAQPEADLDEIGERIWGFCLHGLGHSEAPDESVTRSVGLVRPQGRSKSRPIVAANHGRPGASDRFSK